MSDPLSRWSGRGDGNVVWMDGAWYKSWWLYLVQMRVGVPGTFCEPCTWYTPSYMYLVHRSSAGGFGRGLAQFDQIKPGSKPRICAWHKLHLLCLAQKPPSVPGTTK